MALKSSVSGALAAWLLGGFGLVSACAPAAATATAAAPVAPGGAVADFDPLSATSPTEIYVLPNGLRVVLNQDRRAPVLVVRVVYRVGWRDDPADHPGLAHLVEHLMFHGSKNVTSLQHLEELERVGSTNFGALTHADYTTYWQQLPSSELALLLWLESDRMESGLSRLTEADVVRERHILAREYSENVENAAYGRVATFAEARLFPSGHAYHLEADKGEQLAEVTLAEVREFQRTHYGPNNAVLVLSGDFEIANARAGVQHYFASIASRPVSASTRPGEATMSSPNALATRSGEPSMSSPGALATTSKLLVEANVLHPRVTLSWRTPALFQPGDAELDVVAYYLNRELFAQRGANAPFRIGARAEQWSRQLGSVFNVVADLPGEGDVTRLVTLVEGKLAEVAKGGIDTFAVSGAAFTFLYQSCLQHDALLSRSQQLANSLSMLGDSKYLDHQSTRYRMLSSADVQKAAAQYLKPELRVLTVVKPTRQAPIAGKLVNP